MDYKLASATGVPAPAQAHRRFLSIARRGEVFVKMVVTAVTKSDEVEEAASLIAAEDARVPLVIQPVTERPGGPAPPDSRDLLRLHAAAARVLVDVRVIGQTHLLLGVR